MIRTQPADPIAAFLGELERRDASVRTVESYRRDLTALFRWFHESLGLVFTPPGVTPTDIRDYRSHLSTVARAAPATINRKLAALRSFFRFAKTSGWVKEDPTEG